MPRPRTPKRALRAGLAATLLIALLGACQQIEEGSVSGTASEVPPPEPVIVAIEPAPAAEPVVEAPVPVAAPPRPRRTAPRPVPATPVVGTGALSGNVAIGTVTSPEAVVTVPAQETAAPGPGPLSDTPSATAEAAAQLALLQEREEADRRAQADEIADLVEQLEPTGAGDAPPIPQFPWPPPRASATAVIPAAFVRPSGVEQPTLGDIADEISEALDVGGYFERSFFAAPAGFAMVTRLERINLDGTSAQEAERWTVGALPLGSFSLGAYLRALFTAPSGHYRIIVFVVSSQPFAQSETEVARSEALAWLSEGLNRLPDSIAEVPYTGRHTVTALIYEFQQPGSQEAMLMLPGNLMGRVHLQRAQLWDAFRQ